MNTIKIKKIKKRNIFNKLIFISLLSLLSLGAHAQAVPANAPVIKMATIGTNGDEVAICLEWPANTSATSAQLREVTRISLFYDEDLGTITKTDIQGAWGTGNDITEAQISGQRSNPDNFAYIDYTINNASKPNFGNVTVAGTVDTLFYLVFSSPGVGRDFRLLEAVFGTGVPGIDRFMTDTAFMFPNISFRFNASASYLSYNLTQSLTNLTLPVELIEFNATPLDETVAITWQTASEVNNSHFVLQRSKEGLTWESITTIPGSGNSNTILSYQHFDLDPFKARSYYRLKQVDFDGQYAYSDVEVVDFDNELNVKVTPNPSRSVLSVNLKRSSGVKTIELSDMKGVRLYHKQAGDQTTFNIDVSQYSPGIYILQIMGDHGKVETRKIIKE